MGLAPLASARGAVPAGVPFTVARDLDAGAVHQRVQWAVSPAIGVLDGECPLAAAQGDVESSPVSFSSARTLRHDRTARGQLAARGVDCLSPCRLTNGLTEAGGTRRASWPGFPIFRPRKGAPPPASIATTHAGSWPKNSRNGPRHDRASSGIIADPPWHTDAVGGRSHQQCPAPLRTSTPAEPRPVPARRCRAGRPDGCRPAVRRCFRRWRGRGRWPRS